MKKIVFVILSVTMLLAATACRKHSNSSGDPNTATQTPSKPTNTPSETTATPGQQGNHPAPEGSVTDKTQLGEAISYRVDFEGNLFVSIKTSADIKAGSGWLGICPLGIYLTEEAADAVDSYYEYFDSSYDKEWFDGIYTFALNNDAISPDTYTMVLCDNDDNGNIIGEWIFDKRKNGIIEIGFDDSWLKGAGESRHSKKFDRLEDEVASWFTFHEYNDEWAEFYFDGYYLEEVDPSGYDKYYLMVCPEGDYSTCNEALDAHVGDYSDIREKCPYLFSIDHSQIETGKYTIVLAKNGSSDNDAGKVEIQFGAEKVSDTAWKLDFSNAKCPALESKYK